jgi:hypothetical protein
VNRPITLGTPSLVVLGFLVAGFFGAELVERPVALDLIDLIDAS